MTTAPDVRVGIVSWNVADHLDRCLEALPAALAPLRAEVVVVDNASVDASADVARSHDGVRVIPMTHNAGYARAMNRALAGASSRALIALNPDTVPQPGSLSRLVRELDEYDDAAVTAPLLVGDDGRIEHSIHRFPTLGLAFVANLVPSALLARSTRDRLWLAGAVRPERSGDVDWAVGAVHCIRRSAVDADAVYGERWFMYVEDVDLCWRLAEAGWRTRFVGDAVVLHVGAVSATRAFGDQRRARWIRETYDWFTSTHGRGRVRVYAGLNLIAELRYAAAALVRAILPGRARGRARLRLRGLRTTLPLHLRVAVGRPPPRAVQ